MNEFGEWIIHAIILIFRGIVILFRGLIAIGQFFEAGEFSVEFFRWIARLLKRISARISSFFLSIKQIIVRRMYGE